jgi:uncharacterized protein YdiU (UPF0061 family)
MKLEHTFTKELTSLGSEVKAIKLIDSRLAVFNHDLASELNLPSEWQHESHLFNAMYAEHGVLNQTQRQTHMRQHNPHIVLRNYLAQQVIDSAEEGNFEMFHPFIGALKKPYEDIPEYQKFSALPPDWGKELEISCSS